MNIVDPFCLACGRKASMCLDPSLPRFSEDCLERTSKVKIEIGYIALSEKNVPYSGGQYSAGAKVYKSEASARASLRNQKLQKWRFVPAFIEIPNDEDVCDSCKGKGILSCDCD